MSKKGVRISTKQPGIYKNMVTGKYDVKYCYSEVDPLTNEKKHRQKWYWVHFYEDDISFERIWRQPNKYLNVLKRFDGVISPDFSLYRDMPLVMQQWNIYRSHAIGTWLQDNGIRVIPNVRFGDERTYESCCYGVTAHGTIAIGTHGCVKSKIDRTYLKTGVDYIIKRLNPKVIVIYGTAPVEIFDKYRDQGIVILRFDSSFAKSRKGDHHGNG